MKITTKYWWLRFACFIIGWDYKIVADCSELTKRDAKRYIAAVILVCIIWFFVGFSFGKNYLNLNGYLSIVSGVVGIISIIQIERLIITSEKSNWVFVTRFLLALIMSAIGAIMIDQYIFHNDIELKIQDSRKALIDKKIKSYHKELDSKLSQLKGDLAKVNLEIKNQQDRFNNEVFGKGKSSGKVGYGSIAKGQESYLKSYTQQRKALQNEISKTYSEKLDVMNKAQKEVMQQKRGLLEEFKIMIDIIKSDYVTGMLYAVFLLFFLFIEMLVVITKYTNKRKNDYENIVDFQLEIRFNQLQTLEVENTRKIGRNSSISNSQILTSREV